MTIPEITGNADFNNTAAKMISGGFSLNPIEILNKIISQGLLEVRDFSKTAVIIFVLALLSSAIANLNSSLGEHSGGRAAFFVFFAVISGLALSCFMTAMQYGSAVVYDMTAFMNKFTPVLMIALFSCGKPTAAAAFEPVLSAGVFVISIVIEKCLVPLITFSAVLSVAGNIDDRIHITGFIKTIKSITKWLMAFIITLFTGINTIYGFTTSSLDALSIKTAKFAVGSLVPVVGGFLSDTLETVLTSAGLVKNAVGGAGIIVLSVLCFTPIIKLAIMQLILKLCSAVAEPIADRRISAMLWSISESITSVFGVVILTSVLFIVNICIILRSTL